MLSLAEISSEQIWNCLTADARESLINHVYVPYVKNIAFSFYECSDDEHLDSILDEFECEFPELVEFNTEAILTKYEKVLTNPEKRFGPIIAIKIQRAYGHIIIRNGVPFNFHRNNRLIAFFLKHNMPLEIAFHGMAKGNQLLSDK